IWWSEVLGGPARYTEDLGGYDKMVAHHRGLAIAPEERHRFVSLLRFAAHRAGLPEDPEFRSALVAYAEWGSRLAMHNSQPDAQVFEHAPVPRWGWGEAPPLSQQASPDPIGGKDPQWRRSSRVTARKSPFDRIGEGAPVVLVGGAFSWRRWKGFLKLAD